MAQAMPFGQVVEAADQLSREEQEELVFILQRRLAEQRRKRIVQEVEDAKKEFASGGCKAVSVDQLLREIQP